MDIYVVTGMSGAGKSSLLNFMEDNGFYCIDNMPPVLLPKFFELIDSDNGDIKKLAFGMDIRGKEFFNDMLTVIDGLEKKNLDFKLIFLDARDSELIKRFNERRRPHPLSKDGSLKDGIQKEREILKELKNKSDYIIDTSSMKSSDLKDKLYDILSNTITRKKLTIVVESFGFKYGILEEADLVFDVRFLPNPYYLDDLRPLSGLDDEIKEFLEKFDATEEFFKKLVDMLEFLLPNYIKEGKNQLTIGMGCTGGRHRSVYMAERLYEYLKEKKNLTVLKNRDMYKEARNV